MVENVGLRINETNKKDWLNDLILSKWLVLISNSPGETLIQFTFDQISFAR